MFLTEATFALPIYRWLPTEQVVEQVFGWWQENAAAGRCSMLFCYALGKAQRLLAGLRAHTDRPVFVHGAVAPLTDAYREDGVEMLPTLPVGEHKGSFSGELGLRRRRPAAHPGCALRRDRRASRAAGCACAGADEDGQRGFAVGPR